MLKKHIEQKDNNLNQLLILASEIINIIPSVFEQLNRYTKQSSIKKEKSFVENIKTFVLKDYSVESFNNLQNNVSCLINAYFNLSANEKVKLNTYIKNPVDDFKNKLKEVLAKFSTNSLKLNNILPENKTAIQNMIKECSNIINKIGSKNDINKIALCNNFIEIIVRFSTTIKDTSHTLINVKQGQADFLRQFECSIKLFKNELNQVVDKSFVDELFFIKQVTNEIDKSALHHNISRFDSINSKCKIASTMFAGLAFAMSAIAMEIEYRRGIEEDGVQSQGQQILKQNENIILEFGFVAISGFLLKKGISMVYDNFTTNVNNKDFVKEVSHFVVAYLRQNIHNKNSLYNKMEEVIPLNRSFDEENLDEYNNNAIINYKKINSAQKYSNNLIFSKSPNKQNISINSNQGSVKIMINN